MTIARNCAAAEGGALPFPRNPAGFPSCQPARRRGQSCPERRSDLANRADQPRDAPRGVGGRPVAAESAPTAAFRDGTPHRGTLSQSVTIAQSVRRDLRFRHLSRHPRTPPHLTQERLARQSVPRGHSADPCESTPPRGTTRRSGASTTGLPDTGRGQADRRVPCRMSLPRRERTRRFPVASIAYPVCPPRWRQCAVVRTSRTSADPTGRAFPDAFGHGAVYT